MAQDTSDNPLVSLSSQFERIVEQAGASVVRVDDGTRLTATGVAWSADGVVVATSHGVERDEDLAIETGEGARIAATLVGRDPDTDIAVLRVAGSAAPPLARAGQDDVRAGSLVVALGRPGRRGLQATLGMVSARVETQTGGKPGYLLHTDAVLYPGFSGGPLVDVSGLGVGMNNLLYGRGRGIAIGATVVEQVVETLLAYGRIRRGYLGVRTQPVELPAALRDSQAAGQATGLLVVQVEPGSPAEKAGLILGDMLLALGGAGVEDGEALRHGLRSMEAGQEVVVRLLRGGEARDVTVVLGALDE